MFQNDWFLSEESNLCSKMAGFYKSKSQIYSPKWLVFQNTRVKFLFQNDSFLWE